MAIIRWNPFNEMDWFNRDFSRVFNSHTNWHECAGDWTPRVDVFETENAIMLTGDLPGLDKQDVQVNVEENILTLSGERKRTDEENKDQYTRIERSFGKFERSYTLPNTVDQTRIEATMEKGVLRVSLPKKEEAQPKQIEVKVG